jgi:7,8-dihydropterin-6-yl-methyl-4-(beta-D-ribofuranosyl)aminobenzene 5'-phosphate synthase
MLQDAEITALVEMSEQVGPPVGRVLGKASPVLVGLALHVQATTEQGEPYRLLFDTSTSWSNLRGNAEALGIDLRALDAIAISHWHYDHTAALPRLLRWIGRPVPIYAPPLRQPLDPLKGAIAMRLPKDADLRICTEPTQIVNGIRTTGSRQVTFPRPPLTIDEHGLALRVQNRPVTVVVGCSHAPLEWLVDQAAAGDDVGWLVGGFHFAPPTTEERKTELVDFLRDRGLERISPMHCTTRRGIQRLQQELGDRFAPFELGDRQTV